MEGAQNGADKDNSFVDHVEQTISVPPCRHFTKSELKQTQSQVTTETVHSVDELFRETAYLNNVGENGNGASEEVQIEENAVQFKEKSVQETDVELSSVEQGNGQREQSIDRIEIMLEEDDILNVDKVTIVTNKLPKSESSTESQKTGESLSQREMTATTSSSKVTSEVSELFLTEADRQPFMTVDPNEIFQRNDHSKDRSAMTDFLTMKQKRETFVHEAETEFEKVLSEQMKAQREKEEREQVLMDKILGTIPAYRADWKRKNSPQEGMAVGMNSDTAVYQQDFREGVSSPEISQIMSTDMSISKENVTNLSSEFSSYQMESADISDSSVSLKDLEKSVLSQGSVLEPSKIIEVERKFVLTEKSEERLTELGATLLSEKTFHDIYYDTPTFKLILNDLWLRQRDKEWQLKSPVNDAPIGTSCTQYNEITKEREIINELSSCLCLDEGMLSVSLKELVQIGLLSEVCNFKTTRKSYGLKSCSIDLDLTDFGVQIGEIEMIVVDADRIPEALEAIDDISKQLEFQPYSEANLQLRI